jgi:predicted enzyme related to lactoylglutathione lyase
MKPGQLRLPAKALILCSSTVFMAVGGAMTSNAGSFEAPAITRPANSQHLVGKIVWLDLETTDLARAKQFYSAVFGWKIRNYHVRGSDYAVAVDGGRLIGGMLQRAVHKDEERKSAWLPFVSVGDVDAAYALGLQNHAQPASVPQSVPLRGRQALLIDPEGVRFALETSSSGDPADTTPALGDWVWTTLLARDPAEESVFYQKLTGYSVLGAPSSGGFETIRLSSDGHGRIGIAALPDNTPLVRAQWVNYLRVRDTANAVARVIANGGRVLVKPQLNSRGDHVAILADPTGAIFGVMQIESDSAR